MSVCAVDLLTIFLAGSMVKRKFAALRGASVTPSTLPADVARCPTTAALAADTSASRRRRLAALFAFRLAAACDAQKQHVHA
jgi:hypothetical protein